MLESRQVEISRSLQVLISVIYIHAKHVFKAIFFKSKLFILTFEHFLGALLESKLFNFSNLFSIFFPLDNISINSYLNLGLVNFNSFVLVIDKSESYNVGFVHHDLFLRVLVPGFYG